MYVIRPTEISDIYALARNLRDGDQNEVTTLGFDSAPSRYLTRRDNTWWKNPNPLRARSPAMALRASFRHAVWRRTLVIDGEIAAVGGLGMPSFLSSTGHPWMLTTDAFERLPTITLVKLGREQVREMLSLCIRLEGHVDARYTQACRFLRMLGFTLGEPEEFGPLKAKFRKFTMER